MTEGPKPSNTAGLAGRRARDVLSSQRAGELGWGWGGREAGRRRWAGTCLSAFLPPVPPP